MPQNIFKLFSVQSHFISVHPRSVHLGGKSVISNYT